MTKSKKSIQEELLTQELTIDLTQKLTAEELLTPVTSDDIELDYHSRFSGILGKLGLFSEASGGDPVPLEVWTGIAQALADASGYQRHLASGDLGANQRQPQAVSFGRETRSCEH